MKQVLSLVTAAARNRALGHPARMRIVAMLRTGELCVCQVTAVLVLAPSTVSAHLAELKRAGLVRERRDGRWVHYAIADSLEEHVPEGMWRDLEADPQVQADAAQVRTLRAYPVEELCRVDLDVGRLVAITEATGKHADE